MKGDIFMYYLCPRDQSHVKDDITRLLTSERAILDTKRIQQYAARAGDFSLILDDVDEGESEDGDDENGC